MLASRDTIADDLRSMIHRSWIKDFLECPYCSGFWIALAWWGAWQLWPHGVLIAAGAVAVTALLPLVEKLTD